MLATEIEPRTTTKEARHRSLQVDSGSDQGRFEMFQSNSLENQESEMRCPWSCHDRKGLVGMEG